MAASEQQQQQQPSFVDTAAQPVSQQPEAPAGERLMQMYLWAQSRLKKV